MKPLPPPPQIPRTRKKSFVFCRKERAENLLRMHEDSLEESKVIFNKKKNLFNVTKKAGQKNSCLMSPVKKRLIFLFKETKQQRL